MKHNLNPDLLYSYRLHSHHPMESFIQSTSLKITRNVLSQLSLLRQQHAVAEQIYHYTPIEWISFVKSINILQTAAAVDHPAYYETQTFLRLLSELPVRCDDDEFRINCAEKVMCIEDKHLLEFLQLLLVNVKL